MRRARLYSPTTSTPAGGVNLKVAAGKVFAGLYALYAGLVFIVTAALLFTPVLHRVIHRFHWDEKI